MVQRSIRSSRQDRLDSILGCLIADETASAQSLAARFDVSLMTMHRDLDELQRRGIVRKFRGGVSVQRTSTYEITAPLRRLVAVPPQKRAIAAAAAALVSPGQAVLLDDSTTAASMLDHVLDVEDLHIVTNYLPALNRIAEGGTATSTAIGGTYDAGHESFLGVGAAAAIRAIRVDTAFLSTTTADAEARTIRRNRSSASRPRCSVRRAGGSCSPTRPNSVRHHCIWCAGGNRSTI